ncbi:putative protein UXT -like protein [Capsicum annuum]|nr:putative protein UXT -like protein [Capsicum annuum]
MRERRVWVLKFQTCLSSWWREGLNAESPNSFVRALYALVKAYASLRMFDESIDVLFQTKRCSFGLSVLSCNYLMNHLVECGKVDMAVVAYKQFKMISVTPNVYTYGIVIKALCRKGDLEEAVGVFEEMEKAGVNVPLDGYACTAVIRGFVNEKKLQEAETVLLDMEEQGMVPDAFCYGACLCKNGKASDAVDQFSRFKNKGIFLDEVAYNGVIDALCKLGRFEEAEKLLDEMKGKRMTPDIVHYTTLINGYCLHGRILDAMGLFDKMKEKGLKPDVITYNVLAGGFSRNGLLKEALNLLDHMKGQRLTPTTVTHNMIIEGLCIGGYAEEAEIFINSLENKSTENYAALVNGYCELGNTKGAFGLFVRLSKQGVLIKRKSPLKLLSNLCLEGEYEKALKLFEIVLALGDDTCKIMYSKLIASLCSAGDMKSSRWVFDNLIWRGLAPDVVIYTVILNGYCRSNSLQEALNLFDDMKKRGISPDVITYTVMLDGHSKNIKRDRLSSGTRRNVRQRNDTGLSIEEKMDPSVFLSEMIEAELTADVICYTVLIDSRCKSDNIDDAICLFTEMIDKGLEPDSVTYTALICGYCKQGHVEKAKDLVNKMWRKGIQPDSHTISALHHGIIKAKKLHLRHHNNSAKNQSMKPGVGRAQLSVLILRLQILLKLLNRASLLMISLLTPGYLGLLFCIFVPVLSITSLTLHIFRGEGGGNGVWECSGDVDVMWDRAASCITETAREVLGVSSCRAGRHKGDWWWNEEVKKKVEGKKGAYVKLIESKDEEEKRVNREAYKVARKEAKLVVTATKTAAFESLLAKARERKGRDLDQVKCIKGEDGRGLVEDVHIKKRWQDYFRGLLNEEGDKSFELGELEHSEKNRDFGYCRRFKVEEVREAIRRMRRGRATGFLEVYW